MLVFPNLMVVDQCRNPTCGTVRVPNVVADLHQKWHCALRKGPLQPVRLLSMSEELPTVVVIVDSEAKIRDFLPERAELWTGGVMTTEPVEIVEPD